MNKDQNRPGPQPELQQVSQPGTAEAEPAKQADQAEQIDDLQYHGLRIIQKRSTFRYGTDAVLLANYAVNAVTKAVKLTARLCSDAKEPLKVLDIGTGTGIVPILMCGKLNVAADAMASAAGSTAAGSASAAGAATQLALEIASAERLAPDSVSKPANVRFDAVELQPEMCELAGRSVALNGQEAQIRVINADIAEYRGGKYDIVTVNPPYVRKGCGILSDISGIARSRHELVCTQEEMIAAAAGLLKHHGLFFMVNRPDRLTDALTAMRSAGIEPAELVTVHNAATLPPVLFLCTGRKNGGKGLKVAAPLLITN